MNLTASTIKTLKPGYHCDGRGLYIAVSASGGKSWLFRWTNGYTSGGKPKQSEMGLGSYAGTSSRISALTIEQARRKADKIRGDIADGKDPLVEKEKLKLKLITFAEMLKLTINRLKGDPDKGGWKVKKVVDKKTGKPILVCERADAWTEQMEKHAASIMNKPVGFITDADVVNLLSKDNYWNEVKSASDLRKNIEKVMETAIGMGAYTGLNPARLEGHIAVHCGKSNTAPVKSVKSLPFDQVPGFMADIMARKGSTAMGVAFTTLTAVRSDEARLAKWDEFDFDAKLWIIPAERMKVVTENDRGGDHVVPLSDLAIEVLRRQRAEAPANNPYVFFGKKDGLPVTDNAFNDKIVDSQKKGGMGLAGVATMHGMRSSFRTWATTRKFDRDASELCLAHQIGKNEVERAYNRAEMLDERRLILGAWADHCNGIVCDNVLAFVPREVAA